ncbi:E3 ubiquitin/ISG15 ligase TRIM25 [Microcaecilia unicolor]|uniref:RING-type E3 ubiquitin transferase n=1 Tax=Microcaecilia unicolor TaxID=1415580 RepID=A0A6P7YM74_9AMPH|nr:E3 ubiquitin/ISG15 ligase TRIM25 [Microcaecilia unicolor]
MAEASRSLGELAEELICPICLCTFATPVTIPCGHNFCHLCLDLTWKVGATAYSCPHCRQSFFPKPELKKNTVLAVVVEQFLQAQEREQQEVDEEEEVEEEEEEQQQEQQVSAGDPVTCDLCLRAPAVRTCLTCMASFCQEHLKPHLESLVFCDHQLRQPLGDLQQRKCPDHAKLLEYFCYEHGKCICCVCAVLHKTCQTSTLQEAKTNKQIDLNKQMGTLRGKLEKVSTSLADVEAKESKVQDIAERKKALLREEFSEIKDLIEKEEEEAMKRVAGEEQRVNQKFKTTHNALRKKKVEIERLQGHLERLLSEDDEIMFLKKAAQLKSTTTKDPFVPYIDFNQKLLQALYRRAFSLKEAMKSALQPPSAGPGSSPMPGEKPVQQFPLPQKYPFTLNATPLAGERPVQHFSPPPPLFPFKTPPAFKPKTGPEAGHHKKPPPKGNPSTKNPSASAPASDGHSKSRQELIQCNPSTKNPSASAPASDGHSKSRQELIQYAEKLCVDINTAHKRVVLSDNCTRISVTDTPQNYSDNPQRFTHCSQVLCQQGFFQGIHYWEIDIQSSTFCGIGIAYKNIDRKGTDSRLGRNRVSWCIEWFNAKLSAWHNDVEEILPNPNPSKVGVLVNCDEGSVIFYSVSKKKISLLYKFQAQFTQSVYPAFWVFSSNTTLSLCQLK